MNVDHETIYIYSDSAIGALSRRNNPKVFLDLYGQSLREELPEESYLGLFLFTDDLVKHVAEHKSVKRFSSTHWAHFLAIDIDRENLDEAKQITSNITEYLQSEYQIDPDLLHIFFSGNKGFHVLIPARYFEPLPHNSLARAFRMFCIRLFGLETVDVKIYEPLRLFRLPNTRHGVSGLYKIPLTFKELFGDIESILQAAQAPRLDFPIPARGERNKALCQVYKETIEELEALKGRTEIQIPAQQICKPKDKVKTCYLKLMEGVGSGSRNESAVRLASHFRKQGLRQDSTIALLLDWDSRNTPSFESEGRAEELIRTIESAYDNDDIDYGCHDPILKTVCGSDCFLFAKKNEQTQATTLLTVEDAALAYIRRTRECKGILFNIPSLDSATRGIMPGHVVQYLACQGGGKTAFAIYLLHQVSLQNKYSLFLSLEMPIEEVFERQCQMVGSITAENIDELVKKYIKEGIDDQQIVKSLFTEFRLSTFNKVITSDKSSMTINEIHEIAELAKAKWPIECLFIDYLGRIDGIGPAYERVSKIVRDIKSLAKDLHVPIIYLNQTNRNIKSVTEMPAAADSRDSGQSEEAADVIIASSRPYYGDITKSPDDQNSFLIRLLKNRRGIDKIKEDIELIFYPTRMQFKTRHIVRPTTYPAY
jgi:hypothetical protein